MIEAVALAFGLAMDATAVAALRGLAGHRTEAIAVPLLFGAFQAGLAALGWLLGRVGGSYVEDWDHWIASGLLFAIGVKLLVDAWRSRPPQDSGRVSWSVLVGLALATSIDAAAAGLTLPLLEVMPAVALGLIGGVTVACCFVGFALGRSIGAQLGPRLSALGGVILVALGVRVLIQHL